MLQISVSSRLFIERFTNLMKRRDLFQNEFFSDGGPIREIINSGERTFDEFLKLLADASKFKSFLRGTNPYCGLVREFFAESTKTTWVDTLPSKTYRWLFVTGLGLAVETLYPTGAAIASAQGISFLDAIFLDKILKGWRPHHFIEYRISTFLKS